MPKPIWSPLAPLARPSLSPLTPWSFSMDTFSASLVLMTTLALCSNNFPAARILYSPEFLLFVFPMRSERQFVETTLVHFAPISTDEISRYLTSEEPHDKAGAYGIQGRAGRYIPRIEGCYFNVVGLPLPCVLLTSCMN